MKKDLLIINLEYTIDPGSCNMLTQALSSLNRTTTAAVVIKMNTPGGLLESMVNMVQAINKTEAQGIPVYSYIVQDGLGASAGSYIAMATDQIWMGTGSEIGPSTPIVEGGSQLQENHTLNGMEALMTGLAEAHGRNVSAAALMVFDDVGYNYEQAFKIHLINGIATNFTNFLSQLNLNGYVQYTVSESTYDQFVSFLSNATIDGILISFGSLVILLDIYHRTILLTILGISLLILGFLGAQLINGSVVGIIMLIMGSVLILLEAKTGHGISLMGGVAMDIAGTAFLVIPYYNINGGNYVSGYSPSPIDYTYFYYIIIIVLVGGFIAFYISRIVRTQFRKPLNGWESMIGKNGTVVSDLAPKGWVSIDGVRWSATSLNGETIYKGENIVVVGINNLTLTVKKVTDNDHGI
ncbi:NfeD family protein [Caldiplasma sukawensis]